MSEIPLSDYVGFIFSEITRARDHADRVSKEIAELYAKDDVLKHFSVPRFKIPEMELTIPVLISGARYSTTFSFKMKQEEFYQFLNSKLNNSIKNILITKNIFGKDVKMKANLNKFLMNSVEIRLKNPATKKLMDEFYKQLKENLGQTSPENIIKGKWLELFYNALEMNNLFEENKKQNPKNDLYLKTLDEVTETIKNNIIVSETKIDNLLVNPETNTVKNGSTDATVFTIKAKIMEEGIFIKTDKDEEGGTETIVEFE